MRRSLLSLVLAMMLALGVVQQRVVLVTLGYEVEKLRGLKDDLLDQNRVLNYNVLMLQSPLILNRRLEENQVQLAPPKQVEFLVPQSEVFFSGPREGLHRDLTAGGLRGSEPMWAKATRELVVRWLGSGRQAEAKPE